MMPFGLDSVVTSLATDTLTVTRPSVDGFDSHGRALPRVFASPFTTLAVVYPEGRNLKRNDPAGYMSDGRIHILSLASLNERDRVTYRGAAYEVESVLGWEESGNFCESVAKKLDAPYEPR